MLLVALVIVLLLLSGGAIVASLVLTQRARAELGQRVSQMVGGAGAAGFRPGGKGADPAWITALE
jgi:hypothetical protein